MCSFLFLFHSLYYANTCVAEPAAKLFLGFCCKIKVKLVFENIGNGYCTLRVSHSFKHINFVIYSKNANVSVYKSCT